MTAACPLLHVAFPEVTVDNGFKQSVQVDWLRSGEDSPIGPQRSDRLVGLRSATDNPGLMWTACVEVFGYRPMPSGPTASGAGVRKPSGNKPAGSLAGCSKRYGDLSVAVGAAWAANCCAEHIALRLLGVAAAFLCRCRLRRPARSSLNRFSVAENGQAPVSPADGWRHKKRIMRGLMSPLMRYQS